MKFISAILLISLTLLVSCSKSPEEQIIGKWVSEDGKSSIELFDSGKGIINDTKSGDYSFDGQKLTLFGNGPIVKLNASVSGNKLIIDGQKFIRN